MSLALPAHYEGLLALTQDERIRTIAAPFADFDGSDVPAVALALRKSVRTLLPHYVEYRTPFDALDNKGGRCTDRATVLYAAGLLIPNLYSAIVCNPHHIYNVFAGPHDTRGSVVDNGKFIFKDHVYGSISIVDADTKANHASQQEDLVKVRKTREHGGSTYYREAIFTQRNVDGTSVVINPADAQPGSYSRVELLIGYPAMKLANSVAEQAERAVI